MPTPILIHDGPKHPVFDWGDVLFSRIQAAAEWCQQTEYEFIKSAILGRLNDVEVLMTGWDEEEEPA